MEADKKLWGSIHEFIILRPTNAKLSTNISRLPVQFLQPDYADATKINVAGLLREWKR